MSVEARTQTARRLNPEVLDRQPPCDPAAEQAVLGSIVHDANVLDSVSRILVPDDFRGLRHATLYLHLLAMRNGGLGHIDLVLLSNRLAKAGDMQAVGGQDYIGEIIGSTPYAANAVYYARIVKDKAQRRRAIDAGIELVRAGYGEQGATVEIVKQARENLDQIAVDTAGSSDDVHYAMMSCAELVQSEFEIRFLVDQLLVAGQPLILAGPMKSLKTSLLVDLSFSLATGGFFLGKFPVSEPVAVGLMTGESGMATIKETVLRVARVAGKDASTVANFIVCDRVPQLASPAHLRAVEKLILDNELQVIAIDPAMLAMDGVDAGNLFVQGQLLRGVSEVCQEQGCTLIICHHTKKGTVAAFEPLDLGAIAWSGFAEFARQFWLVNRREPYEPGTGVHKLWLSAGGSVGHGGRWGRGCQRGRLHGR